MKITQKDLENHGNVCELLKKRRRRRRNPHPDLLRFHIQHIGDSIWLLQAFQEPSGNISRVINSSYPLTFQFHWEPHAKEITKKEERTIHKKVCRAELFRRIRNFGNKISSNRGWVGLGGWAAAPAQEGIKKSTSTRSEHCKNMYLNWALNLHAQEPSRECVKRQNPKWKVEGVGGNRIKVQCKNWIWVWGPGLYILNKPSK